MHRSYQSVLPTHNKLLQKRWDTTYYNEHRRKVHTIKSVVDTKAPPTYMHLHLKLKKLQLEEERLATIERDNRILLEKMSYIMRTRGRVDNTNDYEYKSLNKEKRQNELLRVTKDNQDILRRIILRKPEYSSIKWQDDWLDNQVFLDNISSYPTDWWQNQGASERQRTGRRSKSRKSNRTSAQTSGRSRSTSVQREKSNVPQTESKSQQKEHTKDK